MTRLRKFLKIVNQVVKVRVAAGRIKPKLSNFYYLVKVNNYHSHFAVEILLLVIVVFAVGGNIILRTKFSQATRADRSLLFVHLKNHPSLNEPLLEKYESINLRLSQNHNLIQQVLAASTKDNQEKTLSNVLAPLPTLSGTALLKPNPAGSSSLLPKQDVQIYEVRGGDTVGRIAGAYGVSVETILWENNLTGSGLIKPGQELKILPTTGVKHTVKDGETIASIAKKYALTSEDDIETILEYNEIEIEDHIFPGEEIIIPGGVKKLPPTPARQQYLADLQKEDYQKFEVPQDYQSISGDLIWPIPAARRLSQRFWSRHRAIDVPCRDCEIVAARAGIVELAGWQRGYGNTVVINHGGGLKTRYGHGKQNLVSAGQEVVQGQAIMISGSTGRSTGPHLHFEVKKNNALLDPMLVLAR